MIQYGFLQLVHWQQQTVADTDKSQWRKQYRINDKPRNSTLRYHTPNRWGFQSGCMTHTHSHTHTEQLPPPLSFSVTWPLRSFSSSRSSSPVRWWLTACIPFGAATVKIGWWGQHTHQNRSHFTDSCLWTPLYWCLTQQGNKKSLNKHVRYTTFQNDASAG